MSESPAQLSSSKPRGHSVKVPRLYKVAAKLLREHRQTGTSVKGLTLGANGGIGHPNVKGVFALLSESARRGRQLESALSRSGLRAGEPGLDRDLAVVLAAELLFGKGALAGGSRPVETVLRYEAKLREAVESGENKEEEAVVEVPRYARVNTLVATVEEVVLHLVEEDGYEEVEVSSPPDLLRLGKGQFSRPDPSLLPPLLAFSPGTSFHDHPLYSSGRLMLQDRASCLPVAALGPSPGAVVLDACAAPGMKTTQLAAAVGAKGKVYAVEKSAKRCQVLRKMVSDAGADSIVNVQNADFLTLNPSSYPDVEHVLLDPSCSGSGMRGASKTESGEGRLRSLAFLQAKMLAHAISFPAVRSVAYSTCSVFKEENEMVVASVLDSSPFFEASPCLPGWPRRGEPGFPFSERVARCEPGDDACNGFFVALLTRKKEEEGKREKRAKKKIKEKKRSEEAVVEDGEDPKAVVDHVESEGKAKKNKKRKRRKEVEEDGDGKVLEEDSQEVTKKKKKKKKAKKEMD